MKRIIITFLATITSFFCVNAFSGSDYFTKDFENNSIRASVSKMQTVSSNGINGISTNDVGKLISLFLTESRNGQYGVQYDLFKNNNRLKYRGKTESDYYYDCSFNYLYTGNLSINGKSLGSYVGKNYWKIILRGPHAGAFVMEIVSDDGGAGDLHVDDMRRIIAKSLSASFVREYTSSGFHDYLYKNGNGYILFTYSYGASYFFLNIYASGDKDNLMQIISNH